MSRQIDRFWNGDSRLHPECEMVLAKDYDQLAADNQRLEGEVARLNSLLFEQAYRLERALDATDKAALSTANGEVSE